MSLFGEIQLRSSLRGTVSYDSRCHGTLATDRPFFCTNT